jgi:hypothetical protein
MQRDQQQQQQQQQQQERHRRGKDLPHKDLPHKEVVQPPDHRQVDSQPMGFQGQQLTGGGAPARQPLIDSASGLGEIAMEIEPSPAAQKPG